MVFVFDALAEALLFFGFGCSPLGGFGKKKSVPLLNISYP